MGLITKWQCQVCWRWHHTQRGALLCKHGR